MRTIKEEGWLYVLLYSQAFAFPNDDLWCRGCAKAVMKLRWRVAQTGWTAANKLPEPLITLWCDIWFMKLNISSIDPFTTGVYLKKDLINDSTLWIDRDCDRWDGLKRGGRRTAATQRVTQCRTIDPVTIQDTDRPGHILSYLVIINSEATIAVSEEVSRRSTNYFTTCKTT